MIYQVFCVYDKAAECFGNPQFLRSRSEAVRSFSDVVADPKSPLGAHASDYALFFVGEFVDTSGLFIVPSGGPTLVISALECVPAS